MHPGPTDRSWWLTPNVLGGAYPGDEDPDEAAEKVRTLIVDAGVTLFLDLTTPLDPLEPYAHLLESTQARRVSLPVPDFSVAERTIVEEATALIDAEVDAGGVAYVHCWGGRGRTGTILGCWLARELGGQGALDRLAETRAAGLGVNNGHCPETPAQRAFVSAGARRRRPDPSRTGRTCGVMGRRRC